MATTEKFKYAEGETVLCYHGPLLYEAKCVKFELRNNKVPHYLIHYSGWNKSWDEWVTCPRVLKYNDENLKKQQELLATHGTSKILSKMKSSSRKSTANMSDKASENEKFTSETGQPAKKRTKTEASTEEDYTKISDITISVPDELKQILVDDYQHINNNNKLAILPSSNTVESLLKDYTDYKLGKQFDKNVITATVEALKDYFEAALYTKLLYKCEKSQYNEVVKASNRKAVQSYGSFHFLRLFVKIGELLSYSYWDEICTKQLVLHIEDVLKYLNENRSSLFSQKAYYYVPKKPSEKEKQEKDEK